jgi:hypothetical protein
MYQISQSTQKKARELGVEIKSSKMKNKKIGLFSTYFWWTNGISNTRSKNWPGEGWIKGRTKRGNSSI